LQETADILLLSINATILASMSGPTTVSVQQKNVPAGTPDRLIICAVELTFAR
jgi:hypothetical protein